MTKVPISLHEAAIERYYRQDPKSRQPIGDPVLNEARSAMSAARGFAEQIASSTSAIMRDESKPLPARLIASKGVATRLGELAAKRLDAAVASAKTELEKIARETAPPAPRNPHEAQLQSEVRGVLRGMNDQKRAEAINAAITGADDLTALAFLNGPPLLTGASDSERGLRLEQWRRARYGDTVEREARLRLALEATERGGQSLVAWLQNLSENPETKLAEGRAEAARVAERVGEKAEA